MRNGQNLVRTSRVIIVVFALLCGVSKADTPPERILPDLRDAAVADSSLLSAAPPHETLEDAWQAAVRADQRIAAGRWNVTSASSSAAAAQAERLPSLKLGSEYYALSDQPAFQANLPAPLPSLEMPFANRNGVGFQMMVSQPVYTFGRISHGINAADAGLQAHRADLCRTVLDVKMNVAEIYINVLRTKRLIEVVDAKVVSLEAHAHDASAFFQKGLAPRNDLLAAQVALANAKQESLQIHNMLELANAAYNRALGRPLDTRVVLDEVHGADYPSDIEELTQRAIRSRPEIAALSAQARALREQAASVQAKRLPQVGLQGGYVTMQNDYIEPNGVAVIGLGVEWTPIDSGRTCYQAAALREKAEASLRMYRDAQSAIALEVRQKWLDLQTAIHRVEAIRQATTQAEENLRVARDRYQQQVGTNTEVLDAESLRLQAFTNFYNSSYEAVLADLRLRRAVGSL